jgi:GAF domain-containing protein
MDVWRLAIAGNLLSLARRSTGAQAGTVYRRDAAGLTLVIAHNDELARSIGRETASDLLTRIPLPWTMRSIATYVALTRTAVNIPDVYLMPLTKPYSFNRRVDRVTGFRTKSMLAVPISLPIDGVLQLINATNDAGDIVPFSEAAELAVRRLVQEHASMTAARAPSAAS